MLCVGFEFGDQEILDRVKKRTTVEQMREFAENASKAGIRIHGCFMIGGPGETRDLCLASNGESSPCGCLRRTCRESEYGA